MPRLTRLFGTASAANDPAGDTSGLLSAFIPSDPEHPSARGSLMAASVNLISPLVLLEIEHIVTRDHGRKRANSVNDWILHNTDSQRIVVPHIGADTLVSSQRVQDAYRDFELTDAQRVVLGADFHTTAILAKDHRDFRTVRPLI